MAETKLKSQAINPSHIINAPEGFLINGKIVPSVSSNNLTVALKTLAGTDATASDPIYVRIDGTVRTITSALSVTANAGTNWLNMGGAEFATKEVDLFVYLSWKVSTSSVLIGISRLPYGTKVNDFDLANTTDNGSYYNAGGSALTDALVNIGRFAATLSGGAGYTWSVPTFDSGNLIQRPIYETRWLTYTVSYLGTVTLGNGTTLGEYTINGNQCTFKCSIKMGSTTSVASGSQFRFGNVPIIIKTTETDTNISRLIFQAQFHDNGSNLYALSVASFASTKQLEQWQTGSGIVNGTTLFTWAADDGAFVNGTYTI